MPHNRFFYEGDFLPSSTITLSGDEFSHMFKVMRKENDATVEIINGRNQLALAKICSQTKSSSQLFLQSVKNFPTPSSITLHQAVIKLTNLELVIEKAVELGATTIDLFFAARSLFYQFSEMRKKRIYNILISALKQCGRLYLPKINFITDLFSYKTLEGKVYFGDIREKDENPKIIKEDSHIFIGPEMGFTEEEILYLENQLKAEGVRLNSSTLRSETAAIAALSIINVV